MSEWKPERIARLRQWIATDGFAFNGTKTATDMLDEIERLQARVAYLDALVEDARIQAELQEDSA